MLRDCPCSTKTREVLGNPSPLPSRFPSTLEISLGLRPREISRVSGNLSGVGDGFPNTSLVLVEHGYSVYFPVCIFQCVFFRVYFTNDRQLPELGWSSVNQPHPRSLSSRYKEKHGKNTQIQGNDDFSFTRIAPVKIAKWKILTQIIIHESQPQPWNLFWVPNNKCFFRNAENFVHTYRWNPSFGGYFGCFFDLGPCGLQPLDLNKVLVSLTAYGASVQTGLSKCFLPLKKSLQIVSIPL